MLSSQEFSSLEKRRKSQQGRRGEKTKKYWTLLAEELQ